MRALLIEDNVRLADSLKAVLEQQGCVVDVAHTAVEGNEMAVAGHHDVIVLDVMLDDRDGLELCRQLRRQKVATPILMLTALTATQDKVKGLDAGADDYLTKPIETEELLARLRSVLRRSQSTSGAVLRSGDLVMDLHKHRVKLGEVAVKVSAKEFALLEYFMRNPRQLLTRSMISESVWNLNHESSSNVIDVHVSSLRRKLNRGPLPSRIETVIGSGYRFVEQSGPVDAPDRTAESK